MCGPCAKCYSSACRRGRSQQGCEEESAGEGATDGRELMRGRCVRMACVEGVTRAQRAAGMPGEPSLVELFVPRSEEHTSELQSRLHLVCRLLLEKKKNKTTKHRVY